MRVRKLVEAELPMAMEIKVVYLDENSPKIQLRTSELFIEFYSQFLMMGTSSLGLPNLFLCNSYDKILEHDNSVLIGKKS